MQLADELVARASAPSGAIDQEASTNGNVWASPQDVAKLLQSHSSARSHMPARTRVAHDVAKRGQELLVVDDALRPITAIGSRFAAPVIRLVEELAVDTS